jgi:hypothetical protein
LKITSVLILFVNNCNVFDSVKIMKIKSSVVIFINSGQQQIIYYNLILMILIQNYRVFLECGNRNLGIQESDSSSENQE